MTNSEKQRPVRRPVVVTAMLLVAVAVMLVALRSWLDRPAAEIGIDEAASVAAHAEPVEPDLAPEPMVEPVVAESPTPSAVPIRVATQSGPTKVIMLPARVRSTDPAAAVATESVRQSTLRALRAMPGMVVEEISPAELAAIAPPNAGPLGADSLLYFAVTSRHEGRVVAEIAEQTDAGSSAWQLDLRVLLGPTGGGHDGSRVGKNADLRPEGDVESVGIRYAERIADAAGRIADRRSPAVLSSADAGDARTVLLDVTRSEQERMRSLSQLVNAGQELDSAVIAAAADIATRSASAETRQRVWVMLGMRVYEPALAQPMSYSLLTDVDAVVRKHAAIALAAYAGDATAAAALEHASRNDSSSEVRLAARMAAMNFEEKQAFIRETLLDRSLTPAERLAPTIADATTRMGSLERGFYGAVSTAEVLAYAEIAVAAEDTETKRRSLVDLQMTVIFVAEDVAGLSSADQSKLFDALIESSGHSDPGVRRSALSSLTALTLISGNAEARALLESVVENEPGLAAQLGIADTLAARPLSSINPR